MRPRPLSFGSGLRISFCNNKNCFGRTRDDGIEEKGKDRKGGEERLQGQQPAKSGEEACTQGGCRCKAEGGSEDACKSAAVRNPTQIVKSWLKRFDSALTARDAEAAAKLFGAESYWRDLVSFTWNIKTVEGREQIADMLKATLKSVKPSNWQIHGEASEGGGLVEAWISFETATARGYGHLRLKDGKAWTLLTTMVELKGFEEPSGTRREMGADHGEHANRKNWLERRKEEEERLGYDEQPYVVIVGGGQGALGLGARLRRLGVPTIIVEKNERPGDSWRKRYKSLCLHDPVWYDHMPYLPFPDHWPVFSPKDKIGDWLEMYAKVMELNFWGSTECKHASYDDGEEGMDRRGRPQRRACDAAAEAPRSGHGAGLIRQHAELSRHGQVQGRAAAFEPASGT
jgi:hypothetical protein